MLSWKLAIDTLSRAYISVKLTTTTTTTIKFISLTLPSFLTFLDYQNKLREYWLPRITDKLIMIGSQFVHVCMFNASLGWHTL